MTPLIDATEMYLRTIWELEEEHIPAIRARLVERLNLSAPAVSETVSRLVAEGLVHMAEDRTLVLSDTGRELAVSVMRKHRLAELLLTDVIGLDWEHVHAEACRWEHVISDAVEQRLVELLDRPTHCPHGNPIPGLGYPPSTEPIMTMHAAAKTGGPIVLRRISEKLQTDIDIMRVLRQDGLGPGVQATVRLSNGHVEARVEDRVILLTLETARHLYVTAA